jgi:hypothetical protein
MLVSGQHHAPAAFYSGKVPPVPIVYEAGWASELVWTQRLQEDSFTSTGDRNPGRPDVQSVVRHCTEFGTPALKTQWQYQRMHTEV